MRTSITLWTAAIMALGVACGDDTSTGGSGGNGGSNNTGGTTSDGGSGGTTSDGGNNNTGGTTTDGGSGGTSSDGGMASTGGAGGSSSDGGAGGGAAGVPTVEECTAECEEAQDDVDGSCTAITGDCAMCCGAALTITDCDAEQAAYYECVSSAPEACDADCQAQEDALFQCLYDFCTAGGQVPPQECLTLAGCGNVN